MIGFIWLIVGITIVAIVAPFAMRLIFPHRVTWGEVGASVGISVVFSIICTLLIMFGGKFNTEILNGKVVNKDQVQVSCEHSYQVCSGTGENRVCTTYYDHNWDYDWMVYTTVGDIRIQRVDRQGTEEPPRFSKVVIGEHVAMENSYIDYLKGIESSLLYRKNHRVDSDLQRLVPNYPNVYDYYRSKPVIFRGVGADKSTQNQYNLAMRNLLKEIGGTKQVNVVVVIANTDRAEFGEYLRNEWRNGRKNDQVVVIGAPNFPEVAWSYSFGWSKNQEVNPAIDYDISEIDTLTPEKLSDVIKTNVVKEFKRRPMEEFKSYMWETKVEFWKLILVIILQIAINVGTAYYFYHNDIY